MAPGFRCVGSEQSKSAGPAALEAQAETVEAAATVVVGPAVAPTASMWWEGVSLCAREATLSRWGWVGLAP